jgi:hypothetical protein
MDRKLIAILGYENQAEKTGRFSRVAYLVLAAIALLFFTAINSRAEATFGHASDVFNIGAGARSMAMGGAFTGLSDDASAPYFNPAGLAYLDEHQIMAMHAPLFLDTNYNYFASVHPLGDKWGAVALSDAMLLSDKFVTRDANNTITDTNAGLRNNALFASYAHKLPSNLSGGVNVKFMQQKVAGFSGSDLGLDVGLLWTYSPLLRVGAAMANINSPSVKLESADDKFRPVTRLGIASEVYKDKVLITADMVKVSKGDSLFAGGIEFSPYKLFQLRGGYNANRSYTFGMGVKLNNFHVDYAFSDTDLGAFNKVSFTWAWHNIYKTDLEPPMKEGRAIYPLAGFTNEVAFKTSVPDHMVARWNLVIKNAEGKSVRALGGDLRPPEIVKWDAKNEVGEPVVDGTYNYSFTVNYKNGKSWNTEGNLDLALPKNNLEENVEMNLELNGTKAAEEGMK